MDRFDCQLTYRMSLSSVRNWLSADWSASIVFGSVSNQPWDAGGKCSYTASALSHRYLLTSRVVTAGTDMHTDQISNHDTHTHTHTHVDRHDRGACQEWTSLDCTLWKCVYTCLLLTPYSALNDLIFISLRVFELLKDCEFNLSHCQTL